MLPLATIAASAAIGVGKSLVGALAGTGAEKMDTARASAEAKTRRTANEFETMFLENSLEAITQSAGTEGPLGENGPGGAAWRSMLTREYAGQIVRSGGVGIADQVYREMMKLQEAGRGGA